MAEQLISELSDAILTADPTATGVTISFTETRTPADDPKPEIRHGFNFTVSITRGQDSHSTVGQYSTVEACQVDVAAFAAAVRPSLTP